MKPTTRDNLIYLTVGLGIAALVVADLFYADSHGRTMWMPSRYAFRVVTTTALLAYFVARETRKVKATVFQVIACVLFASVVHLAVGFAFRNAVGQLSGLSFSAWVVLEMFLLVQLLVQVIPHLKSA
jgi:CHASE2 domain-containing sensor protein